ncbi:MAG: LuxR C-terminal-related transcriptional regulator [Labilithrix sp.]
MTDDDTRADIVVLLAAVARRAGGSLEKEDAAGALRAWRGLLAGRWSLVDQFDRAGRRFLVARPTEPTEQAAAALSAREQQVVVYASLAQSNKAIALELGLSEATVSEHLHAAARKLGVRSRLELVRLFAMAQVEVVDGSAPEDPSRELDP